MESILIYLVKGAIGIAAFYTVYLLLFRRQKQFRFNRLYLNSSLCFSFLIPLITITIAKPAVRQTVFLPDAGMNVTSVVSNGLSGFDFFHLLFFGYLSVTVLFFLHLLTGYLKAISIIRKCRETEVSGIRIHITKEDIHPFTFFSKIVVSGSTLSHPKLEMILKHEMVHATEKHTLDILLSEILFPLQWFNPFAWLLKDAIKNNLEFLTDREVLHQADMQAYQMTMVSLADKIDIAPFLNALNGNDLKNRIIMMKKNSNTRYSLLRKLTLLPVMMLLIAGLSGKDYKSATASVPQIAVKGTVTCFENGKAIPMAIVLIKGTTMGTITDDQGNFSIKLQGKTDTLVFVTPDRLKVEIPVNGDKDINVKLKLKESAALKEKDSPQKLQSDSAKRVEEIRVIGYGIQKQEKTKSESNEVISLGRPIQKPGEPLPAFQQNYSDSLGNRIRIRTAGTGSMNEVLYIVDGQEVKNINEISPDKIESISVLKNESATTLYGEKGKNGVILITSKKSDHPADDVLIILDGKETTKKVADINPDEIQSVSVWKGEQATAKYGEKGEKGIIEITMKHQSDKNTSVINSTQDLRKYIASTIFYPLEAQQTGQQGSVRIYAFVNGEGKITQITESKPKADFINIDEVVIVAYASKNDHEKIMKSVTALSEEAALRIKNLPDLDIPELKKRWVVFQFKFVLQ